MITLEPAGVDAVLITFDEAPSAALSTRITQVSLRIADRLGETLVDQIPGWDTLLVHYRLDRSHYAELEAVLRELVSEPWQQGQGAQGSVCHRLPVWYQGEDLAEVATRCGLSTDEVVALHTATDYYVGAVGFVPGFAYLGGGSMRLALPRHESPRTRVPKGSVAITEQQSAIYPQAVPGGWHLIGLCPLTLYDVTRTVPARFSVGDRVRFVAIDQTEYAALEGHWDWPGQQQGVAD